MEMIRMILVTDGLSANRSGLIIPTFLMASGNKTRPQKLPNMDKPPARLV